MYTSGDRKSVTQSACLASIMHYKMAGNKLRHHLTLRGPHVSYKENVIYSISLTLPPGDIT